MHIRLMSLHTILKDYQLFPDNVSDVDNGSERFCKTKNYIAFSYLKTTTDEKNGHIKMINTIFSIAYIYVRELFLY